MHHRASIDLHRTVEKSILTILLHTNTYQAIYTLCLQTNREKSWPIRSLLACEPSGWSLFFEWNSYKVHSYVSVWFLNAKKKKRFGQQGLFFLAKSTIGPLLKSPRCKLGDCPYKGVKQPPIDWPSPAIGSIGQFLEVWMPLLPWLHWESVPPWP